MQRIRFAIWVGVSSFAFGALAWHAQTQQFIPSKTLDFEAVETDPNFALPTTTVSFPHCLSDGSLVLQTINWNAVNKTPKGTIPKYNRIVMIVQGKKVQTILSTSISDLTDFSINDVFPSDTGIYFLVIGTKEQPGSMAGGNLPRESRGQAITVT